MTDFPISDLRAAFPALALTDDNKRRIYLDNPAGTQVPQSVVDAVSRCLIESNANLGGFFATTIAAENVVTEAHQAMADFMGTDDPGEIIIGPNMTSLTYHISRALATQMKPGDEIIVTRMDHEGDVAPWLQMAEQHDLVVRWLPFNTESWRIEKEDLAALLSDRTRLVALNYASNLTGSINDVAALTKLAKDAGALVFVDAVQFAPHGLIDVNAIGCDFLACSSYKFFGPHLGILWGRRSVLESLPAFKCRCTPDDLPERFETGTPQIELMAGLTATIDYLAHVGGTDSEDLSRREKLAAGFDKAIPYERPLMETLISGLCDIDGLTIHGLIDPASFERRVPTVSFTVEGIVPEEIVRPLNEENIFVWSGHNYALAVVRHLGIPEDQGVVRIGIAHYNTVEEISETVEAVQRIIAMLRQG